MRYIKPITKYKVLVNPKVTSYFNKMMHEFSQSMLMTLEDLIDTCDQHLQGLNFDKNMQNMIALDVQAPKTVYNKKLSLKQIKNYLEKINHMYADGSFKKSSDYKSLSTLINSSHDKSIPAKRRLTRFRIIKTVLPIETCLIDTQKSNQIQSKTLFNVGKLTHVVFELKTKTGEYKAFYPVDLPMAKHMVQEKNQISGPTAKDSKAKKHSKQ